MSRPGGSAVARVVRLGNTFGRSARTNGCGPCHGAHRSSRTCAGALGVDRRRTCAARLDRDERVRRGPRRRRRPGQPRPHRGAAGRGKIDPAAAGRAGAWQNRSRRSCTSPAKSPRRRRNCARSGLNVADDVLVFAETDLRAILDDLEKRRPKLLIVDSIQTVWLSNVESAPGSVGQIRECAQALLEFAKRTDCATFLVGHITKDGAIAGPRLLEHLVDTVLYFEGDQGGEFRIIRAYKNRFGSAEEICVFEMGEGGLREIENPSTLFLSGRAQRPSSFVASCRASSVRVLDLGRSASARRGSGVRYAAAPGGQSRRSPPRHDSRRARTPQRDGLGDPRRLRIGRRRLAHQRTRRRSGDRARDRLPRFAGVPLASDAAAFGEIGLAGEVRTVGQGARRSAEARKLGFTTVYSPPEITDVAGAIRLALG